MSDHQPIYDWQTLLLNAVSLAWGTQYGGWLLPFLPSASHAVEWMVALVVGVVVIVLNVLKIQQTLMEIKEKRRSRKKP
jgi:fructose-specific phosphotransferase system IIC component